MQYFKCYSLKLAKYLCKRGFRILDTLDNKNREGHIIFLFEDTEDLRKIVRERSAILYENSTKPKDSNN